MFRRLFVPYALTSLALGVALALAVWLLPLPGQSWPWLLGLVGAFTLASLAGVLYVSRRLAGQLGRLLGDLSCSVEQLRAGVGEPRVFPTGDDGIAQLGQQFNRMSEALTGRIAELEEDRQQLRTILSGMIEGVIALDANQRVLFVNDRARDLLELPVALPVGRRLWEVVRHRQLMDAVAKALQNATPCRAELAWNGRHARSLLVHAARLPGEPPRGAVLVLHDISELRRLERLRQDFVANVSHELKTPLSVIKVCVETLLDGAVEDPAHRGKFLERIASQSDRLHALILDLISLGRIESGEELFDFQSVPLDGVVQDCVERHKDRAEAQRQTLEAEGPPLSVWADEEAIDQILENLLDNALKYTPEGGAIRVTWRAEEDTACLEVSDTGIGIPEADLPRVFERFYRVDKARSRELGGTGLGLSIVKHLAGAMRGGVSAQSRVGQGTTFTVRLPLDRG